MKKKLHSIFHNKIHNNINILKTTQKYSGCYTNKTKPFV